jgi:repressor LexA
MTEPLTPLERRVYHYLIDFLAENTYQPSIREIAKKFASSRRRPSPTCLRRSRRRGSSNAISRARAASASSDFSGTANTQPVPYFGKVHAGEPALLPEHREGYITMDRRFLPSDDVFFLKIKGESMMGAASSTATT